MCFPLVIGKQKQKIVVVFPVRSYYDGRCQIFEYWNGSSTFYIKIVRVLGIYNPWILLQFAISHLAKNGRVSDFRNLIKEPGTNDTTGDVFN